MSSGWEVTSSNLARKTFNPIRKYVENLNVKPNKDKIFIPLNIGMFFTVQYIISSSFQWKIVIAYTIQLRITASWYKYELS